MFPIKYSNVRSKDGLFLNRSGMCYLEWLTGGHDLIFIIHVHDGRHRRGV